MRRFPIDTLKVDQSFVQDLDADEAIIGAIIAMGRCLKHRVIAEGVETPQQYAFLKSHLCTEGQGYYFSRPLVAEEFAALLAEPDRVWPANLAEEPSRAVRRGIAGKPA